jgi:hypothetical protein
MIRLVHRTGELLEGITATWWPQVRIRRLAEAVHSNSLERIAESTQMILEVGLTVAEPEGRRSNEASSMQVHFGAAKTTAFQASAGNLVPETSAHSQLNPATMIVTAQK